MKTTVQSSVFNFLRAGWSSGSSWHTRPPSTVGWPRYFFVKNKQILIICVRTVLRIPDIFGTDPDTHLWLTDPDLEPVIFVSDLQDSNKFSFAITF
jgi:hypothetical protein